MSDLFTELKRRNVLKVAAMYIVTGWLIVQVLDAVIPMLLLPDWVGRAILLLIIVGLPVALILAWAFELTPEGIMREKDVDRTQSITTQTGRRIDFLIIGILVVAVAYFAFDKFVMRPDVEADGSSTVAHAEGDKSIAVLPFVNMSDDPANEYFSDGISEELLNVLVRVKGLRVASRTSSFSFKGTNQTIPEIAAELDVDHILEGSVRKAGQRVRITAQLIDVTDDRHLWSASYDRDLADIFAVQDEIANAIVEALKVALGASAPVTQAATTEDPAAYNEYLRGRYFWNKRSMANFERAIGQFEKAIELDPTFARAWSALAETLVLMPEYSGSSFEEYKTRIETAIARALELGPDSAQAYTARAYYNANALRRWKEAEHDYQRAIELDPMYATAWQWFSEMEVQTGGSGDHGVAKAEKALELDPASPIIHLVLSNSYKHDGQYEKALEHYAIFESMAPGVFFTWYNMAHLYLMKGELDEALEAWLRGVAFMLEHRGEKDGAGFTQRKTYELFIAGLKDPARRQEAIAHIDSFRPEDTYEIFEQSALLGELGAVELALDALERAEEGGHVYLPHAVRYPIFWDDLRDHPRFLAIVEKLNMMEYLP